jgi:hypothetical protein
VCVAWLLSPGSPKSDEPDPEADRLLLPQRPSQDQVANAAVFAASDRAASVTATEINLTAGGVVDWIPATHPVIESANPPGERLSSGRPAWGRA